MRLYFSWVFNATFFRFNMCTILNTLNDCSKYKILNLLLMNLNSNWSYTCTFYLYQCFLVQHLQLGGILPNSPIDFHTSTNSSLHYDLVLDYIIKKTISFSFSFQYSSMRYIHLYIKLLCFVNNIYV